jgi:hydroxymethylpyrimidine pyrophosphatase-like HAD family hydrolase
MNTLQTINPETQIIPEVNFEYFSNFATHRLKQMETGRILTEKGVMYSAATRRIYNAAITLFKEFELLLQSRIKIHEMNGRTVKAFERFLISKGLTLNSVGAYISKIKAVGNFLFAEDIGLKPVKHSVKSEQTTKIYLSIPEIRQLKNYVKIRSYFFGNKTKP